MYLYYMTQRPPMPGAMPRDGLTMSTEYPVKKFVPEIDAEAYAEIAYNRRLTEKEMYDYELLPKYSMIPLTRHELNMIINLITDEVIRDASKADDLYDTYAKLRRVFGGE